MHLSSLNLALVLSLPLLVSGTNHPIGNAATFADVSGLFSFDSMNKGDAQKSSGTPLPPKTQSPPASSIPPRSSAPPPPQNQNPQLEKASTGSNEGSCQMFPQSRLYLFQDSVYFFSLLDSQESTRLNDWYTAREFCRYYCMDLVAIETPDELGFISKMLQKVPQMQRIGLWTSGFFCPSGNCTNLPLQQTPWVYTSTGTKVPSSIWSKTGEASLAQPDNLANRIKRRADMENCMALLRNWYNDGCVAHDLLCESLLGVACEAKLQKPGMSGNKGQGMMGMGGYGQGQGQGMMGMGGYGQGQGMMGMGGYGQGQGMMGMGGYSQGQGITPMSGYGQGQGMTPMSGYGQAQGMTPMSGYGQGQGMTPMSGYGQGQGMTPISGYGQGQGMTPMSGYGQGQGQGTTPGWM